MEIKSQVLVFPEMEMSSAVTDSGGGGCIGGKSSEGDC